MTANQLFNSVLDYFSITHAEFQGPSKLGTLLRARKIAIYTLRYDRGMTFGEISKVIGISDKARIYRLYTSARAAPDELLPFFLGSMHK